MPIRVQGPRMTAPKSLERDSPKPGGNLVAEGVDDFGAEWRRFDQSALSDAEKAMIFERYFAIFPWRDLPADAEGFDLGCGSGRWASLAARRALSRTGTSPGRSAAIVSRI